jgi:hypothetical protein
MNERLSGKVPKLTRRGTPRAADAPVEMASWLTLGEASECAYVCGRFHGRTQYRGPERLMSEKIVFDGREYDGVDAMPPEVRRQYEALLSVVRERSGSKLDALLLSGLVRKIFNVTTTVQARIVVNGKEFHRADDMPAEVRAAYERSLAEAGGGTKPAGAPTGNPPPSFRPPPVLDEDQRRGGWRRRATWVAIAILLVLWVFRKSILGH